MKPNAKSLITGEINESPGDMPPGTPRAQGAGPRPGPPQMRTRRHPLRPGEDVGDALGMERDQARPGETGGILDRKERQFFKDLVLLDLLNAMGGDPFYASLVKTAIDGGDPDASQIRHFLDEAGKFQAQMSPGVNELMGKLASLPQ